MLTSSLMRVGYSEDKAVTGKAATKHGAYIVCT